MMNFDLISFLIGIQLTGFVILMGTYLTVIKRDSLKYIPILFTMAVAWEIGLPVTIYLSGRKQRKRRKQIKSIVKKEVE